MMNSASHMESIDLKDAHYTIPVDQEQQKYLKFSFNGTLFQYICLPNRLTSAPRRFTNILKPVFAHLRNLGHLTEGTKTILAIMGITWSDDGS